MSLRGFHIFFILLSVLVSFGLAFYEFVAFRYGHALSDGLISAIAAVIAVLLAAYGVWFIRKPSPVAA